MPTRPRTSSTNDNNFDKRLGILEYKVDELKHTTDRIETKLDAASYVHTGDYAADKQRAEERFATKEELKPIKNLFYAMISTIILGLVTAFLAFVVQGGLK